MESQVRRAGGLQNQRLEVLEDVNTRPKRLCLSKIGEGRTKHQMVSQPS